MSNSRFSENRSHPGSEPNSGGSNKSKGSTGPGGKDGKTGWGRAGGPTQPKPRDASGTPKKGPQGPFHHDSDGI